jgi:hypothetical protein
MTHDSLCSWCREPDCTRHIPNHDQLCPYSELPSPCFTCDLIAKARFDERQRIIGVMERNADGDAMKVIDAVLDMT